MQEQIIHRLAVNLNHLQVNVPALQQILAKHAHPWANFQYRHGSIGTSCMARACF